MRSSGGDALMPRGVKVKGGVLYIALRIHIHEIQTPPLQRRTHRTPRLCAAEAAEA